MTVSLQALQQAERLTVLEQRLGLAQANYNEALDTIWMLMAAMLVFFMHAGFSMLEAGCVRFKNTQNILGKNLIVVTVGFLCWYFVGYAVALGKVEGRFAGGTNFVMHGLLDDKSLFRVWFFQGAFCATGGTIVSGAMAERTQLKGFTAFTCVMTCFIYPVIVYWGWSTQGFLNYKEEGETAMRSIVGPPLMDFAGSGIVHLAGGVGALCGAVVVGARKDRWDADKENEFAAHSIPFCVLGTFFLWFGWYGFNPGSTGAMKTQADAHTAALVAVNTTLAPCVAGLVVFFLRAQVVPPLCLDVGGFCNGILAGLVAITAACASVKPWESIIIGFFGGLFYQGASMLLRRLRIDDVVDAVPVHFVNGLWGIIACGFFGDPAEGLGGNGAFYGGNQLGVQLFAALLIIVWVAALSLMVFIPARKLGALRMSDKFQDMGADVMEHSPPKAYNGACGEQAPIE